MGHSYSLGGGLDIAVNKAAMDMVGVRASSAMARNIGTCSSATTLQMLVACAHRKHTGQRSAAQRSAGSAGSAACLIIGGDVEVMALFAKLPCIVRDEHGAIQRRVLDQRSGCMEGQPTQGGQYNCSQDASRGAHQLQKLLERREAVAPADVQWPA